MKDTPKSSALRSFVCRLVRNLRHLRCRLMGHSKPVLALFESGDKLWLNLVCPKCLRTPR